MALASDRLAQINAHLNYPQGLFANQTVIVTGAGQGIGAEAARLFANEGAKVVVADIDESEFSRFASLVLIFLYFLGSQAGNLLRSSVVWAARFPQRWFLLSRFGKRIFRFIQWNEHQRPPPKSICGDLFWLPRDVCSIVPILLTSNEDVDWYMR